MTTALVSVPASELAADSSARLWALVLYLADNSALQLREDIRPFWLVYTYDAEVLNGGHLQYFHNCGTGLVEETVTALGKIGARKHAALLDDCWKKVQKHPIQRIGSLQEYSELAAERSFKAQDTAYYSLRPEILDLLEKHYADLLAKLVAVRG